MKIFFSFLLGIAACTNLFAQHRSIVIADPQGQDKWIIREHDRIKYQLKADFHGWYKGKVKQVKDSSIMIGGKEIFFSKIKSIKLSRGPARKSIFLGMVLAGVGAAAQPLNDKLGDPVPGNMILVGQIGFIGPGSYFIIRGIVNLFSNHTFNLYQGWTLRSIPVAELDE